LPFGDTFENMQKLAIVIGHNFRAQGAQAVKPLGLSEYIFNLRVADEIFSNIGRDFKIQQFLRKPSNGVTAELREVYAQVNAFNPALTVELHFNCANGKAAYSSMWYHHLSTRGAACAKLLQAAFRDFGDGGARALMPGERGFLSANFCRSPFVLGEPFFGDNPGHAQKVFELGADGIAARYSAGIRGAMAYLKGH
jgi:N-acetylmuramoyl-L-alanine amidase